MRQFNQKTHALRFELGGKIRVAAPLGEVVPEIEDEFVYAIRDMGLPLAMTQAEPPEHWRSAEEAEAKAKADAEKAEAKRMKSEAKTKADEDAAAAKVKADAEAETERQVMESEKAKAEAEAKAKADAEAPKKGK